MKPIRADLDDGLAKKLKKKAVDLDMNQKDLIIKLIEDGLKNGKA